MFGTDQLYAALNISAITDLLDARGTGDTRKALFGDMLIPSSYTLSGKTVQVTAKKTLNFYRVSPISSGSEVMRIVFNAVCRAPTQAGAETIAAAVYNNLHRRTYIGYYIRCTVLKPIPPADQTDTYNQTVECELIIKPEV